MDDGVNDEDVDGDEHEHEHERDYCAKVSNILLANVGQTYQLIWCRNYWKMWCDNIELDIEKNFQMWCCVFSIRFKK